MAKRGRPLDPNGWVIHRDTLCERLTQGETLRAICRDLKINPSTISQAALRDTPTGFNAQYAQARANQAHAFADDIVEEAYQTPQMHETAFGPKVDSGWVQLLRVRIDAKKWLMSKINPQAYGDKLDVTSDGKSLAPIALLPPELLLPHDK
jgi:hypothetical protein